MKIPRAVSRPPVVGPTHWAVMLGLVLLLLAPVAGGCGGSGSTTVGAGGGEVNPQPQVPTTPAFSGRVATLAVMAVPERERAAVLQGKAEIESGDLQVLGEGEMVIWPLSPAAGWTAELGSQQVLVDADGAFAFQEPADASVGFFYHPSEPGLAFEFTVEQLGIARDRGHPVIVPLIFKGPCGMSFGDIDEFCGRLQPRTTDPIQAAAIGPTLDPPSEADLLPPLLSFNKRRQLVAGRLGTYADPKVPYAAATPAEAVQNCVIDDGIARFRDDVPAEVKYFFSTCDQFIKVNACLNENFASDLEYELLRRSLVLVLPALLFPEGSGDNVVENAEDVLTRLRADKQDDPTLKFADLSCYQNHKGRNCSMINMGDLACLLPGDKVVKASPRRPSVVVVGFSRRARFVLHNNGAFGITKIKEIRNEIGGRLNVPTPPGRTAGKYLTSFFGIQEIHHFDPPFFRPTPGTKDDVKEYLPDLAVEFIAPEGALVESEATYEFMVDRRSILITFRVLPPGLYELPNPPGVQYLGVNDAGTVLYNAASGDSTQSGLFLKPFGADPVQIASTGSQAAALNSDDDVLYKDESSKKVFYVSSEGQRLEVTPPKGASLTSFIPLFLTDRVEGSQGVGSYAVGTFQEGLDAWVAVAVQADTKDLLDQGFAPTQAVGIPSKLGSASFTLAGLNDDLLLIGNGSRPDTAQPGDTLEVTNYKGLFDKTPVKVTLRLISRIVGLNFSLDLSSGVLKPVITPYVQDHRREPSVLENLYNVDPLTELKIPIPVPPPPGNLSTPGPPFSIDLNNEGQILATDNGRITVDGRSLGNGSGLAINDQGEVAGANAGGPVLFSRSGASTALDTVVASTRRTGNPDPEGPFNWLGGRMMRGKFSLVTAADGKVYLLARP